MHLVTEDRIILEGVSWLNDSIIQAAQDLIKKETDLDGLQTPLCGINFQFKPVNFRVGFVQILHVNSNHWIVVSNKLIDAVRKDDVYIYDSLVPRTIGSSVIKQVCCLMKSPAKKISFNVVDVMRQRNSYDCGLHAVAAATDIVFRKDPAKSQWDLQKLRPHLIHCLKRHKMTPFPVMAERRIRFACRVKSYSDVEIHCSCRMPYDCKEPDGMIQCHMCNVWYHGRCIAINIDDYKHCNWLCTECTSIMNH